MSSQVPIRRTTRVTRTTIVKNKENSTNARATNRAKPTTTQPAAAADVKPTVAPRATVSTIATRAKASAATSSRVDPAAQGKRKREALGEVARPAPNVTKAVNPAAAGGLKGKEKAKETFDGVHPPTLKNGSTTATTTVRTRIPSTSAAATTVSTTTTTVTRKTRSAIPSSQQQQLDEVKEEEEELPSKDDNAMAIDPPAPVAAPRRFTAARAAAAAVPHAVNSTRTSTTRRAPPRHVSRIEEEDAEQSRVTKKRRTSSDAPDADVRAEEEVEEAVKVEDAEADPNGDQWQDLDLDDGDDPLMVSEYVVEIFDYLKDVEQTTMPNPNYMEMQKDLAWKMRGILTDWLIQVHSRFRLLPETLYLCVNIIDRFLSQRVVSLAKLQLVGITCMFVAAKVEEIVAPGATNFLYCADSSYTEAEILQAERYILKTLDWNMSFPNPIHFLRRISKADDYNVHSRTIAKYLLEIQCLEWRLIAAPPSLIAAAAIWLARLILGNVDWTANLAHYSSYAESTLIPTANLMLNYILKPVRHQSFYKKYSGKRFLKVSSFCRDWALDRWSESEQVSLHEELPRLKLLIQEAREQAQYADEVGASGYAEE
ncbi:G2/mitotic-specific cyclin [Steccherinum ochraceum]|uniref:G2/mitotic-specific cyclin n=1 Tax=Steccherinum ochraceum TaxID=92696 RepID=A0A4V2MW77_9APHY|nr:G2/mitotic-specific cyclin [Steccherinum ochraceum]